MEWINVNDRLPNEEHPVLVCYEDIGYNCGFPEILAIDGSIWYRWFNGDDSNMIPTHWMPLPEPPKTV
tara:strand:- start:6507 stop:6710 length:204 start_codon:yes stop_codon:yes gene_type:complete